MSSYSAREDEVFERPSAALIQSTWQGIFSDPLLSTSRLRAAALSKDGLGEADHDGGVILRSLYWRFYLGLLPPPTSLNLFASALSIQRENYNTLRESFLVAPDGRWADDCSQPDDSSSLSSARPSPSAQAGQTTFDPLSLDEQSPWKTWYAHLDLRKVIMQDVDRTFPDIPYFAMERVKRCMVTMLFLFSVLNPDVGYRQGMHELLAVCLLVVDRDSLVQPESHGSAQSVQAMYTTLDRRYVEHDAFELFTAIMKPARAFYEWRQEEGPRLKGVALTQAPIVVRSNNLHSSIIRRIDPQLWEKMENEGVEAQIWAMRWYKLIFTRELPFPLALKLWDGIFAEDPGLGILDFICAAMVLLIRNELLDSDHAGLLTNLLRYPSPSPLYPFSPFLILSQALLLRNSITPTTGVEVVIQNSEVLGIKPQPPSRDADQVKPTATTLPRVPQRGVQGLAAGLFERAQAAGLDRAILSTVADIRRNIPDSAYSYLPTLPFSPSQTPAARDSSGSFSTFPSLPPNPRQNQNQNQQHPSTSAPTSAPLQPSLSADSLQSAKTLRDAERELAELRLAMVGMGKAMSEWLTALPPDTGPRDRAGLERIKETLLDAASRDVDDIVKEWGWHDGLEAPSSSSETSRAVTPSPSLTESDVAGMGRDDIPLARERDVGKEGDRAREREKDRDRQREKEEKTPTPVSVPAFQHSSFPSPGIRSAPISHSGPSTGATSSSPRIQPHQPSRVEGISTALPRTPLTAPPTRREPPRTFDQPRNASSPSISAGTRSAAQNLTSGMDSGPSGSVAGRYGGIAGAGGDPLAGLGVGAVGSPPLRSRTQEVDPLLGIGIRK